MPDEFFSRTPAPPPARPSRSVRGILIALLLAFAAGVGLVTWLVWDGRVTLDKGKDPALLAGMVPDAARPAASPSPTGTFAAQAANNSASMLEQRLGTLEQRLARIDLQANAAEGNTARAEALLIAFAARRSIERGASLGYLAGQLRLRFGDAQPAAVETVLAAATHPTTLDQLSARLDELGPQLIDAPADQSGWDKVRRKVGGLFVIHRGPATSVRPQDRLDRAQMLLRSGQFDAAVAEVSALPGARVAASWQSAVQRYALTQRALDQIETAALLEPARLKDAGGDPVRQASPAMPPSPEPAPSAAPSPVAAAN